MLITHLWLVATILDGDDIKITIITEISIGQWWYWHLVFLNLWNIEMNFWAISIFYFYSLRRKPRKSCYWSKILLRNRNSWNSFEFPFLKLPLECLAFMQFFDLNQQFLSSLYKLVRLVIRDGRKSSGKRIIQSRF